MRFGIVGLGKMGRNIATHAREKGHPVVGYDATSGVAQSLADEGVTAAASFADMAKQLEAPRTVFLYVPHGAPTDDAIAGLAKHLSKGDLIADGGNSHWRDSRRRYAELAAAGINFLDVGTSGGMEGARRGACFMVGGEPEAFARVERLLIDLAVPDGVIHAGRAGAGHFVKLVHNAIEFGMVQAIAEGVDLLRRFDQPLDLPALFHNWNHGSVIRSWLVELMERGLREENLDGLSGYVEDTREVRWIVEYALEREAWIPVTAQAELAFYRYRDPESTAGKAVALMRHGYGGHPLHRKTRT